MRRIKIVLLILLMLFSSLSFCGCLGNVKVNTEKLDEEGKIFIRDAENIQGALLHNGYM